MIAATAVVVVGFIIWSFYEPKIRSTFFTVVVAVAASGGLWVGANMLFDQVRDNNPPALPAPSPLLQSAHSSAW